MIRFFSQSTNSTIISCPAWSLGLIKLGDQHSKLIKSARSRHSIHLKKDRPFVPIQRNLLRDFTHEIDEHLLVAGGDDLPVIETRHPFAGS